MLTGIAARLGGAIRALAGCFALSACASLTSGTEQTISVVTAPVANASCTLRNAHGLWRIARTPAVVTVQRAYGDLTIACVAADGVSAETTRSSTVAPATFGNILLMGSVVWAAVDAASGAAFAYPDRIAVKLESTAVAAAPALGASKQEALEAPQSRIAALHQMRAEHRISALDYQRRLADIAAEIAQAERPPAVASALVADDAQSRLRQLKRLRAEYRISAMEYQLRLAEMIERGELPADAAKDR